jgi:hypothetical protein
MQLSRYGKYCRYRPGAQQFIGRRDLYKGARRRLTPLFFSFYITRNWLLLLKHGLLVIRYHLSAEARNAKTKSFAVSLFLSLSRVCFFSYFYRQDDADDDETLRPVDLEEGGV